jgi:hypothetical protein
MTGAYEVAGRRAPAASRQEGATWGKSRTSRIGEMTRNTQEMIDTSTPTTRVGRRPTAVPR